MARKSATVNKATEENTDLEAEFTPEYDVAAVNADPTDFDETDAVEVDTEDELDIDDEDESDSDDDDSDESDETDKPKKSTGKHPQVDRSTELSEYENVLAQLTVPQQQFDDGTVSPGYDPESGALSDQALEFIVNAYRALAGDRKRQKIARDAIGKGLNQSVIEGDPFKARAFLAIDTALKASKPVPAAQRAPADPTTDFVNRFVATHLAQEILDASVPTEVADDWRTRAETLAGELIEPLREYTAWLAADEEDRGDEPDVSPVVRAAVKMAQGKAPRKPGSGTSSFEGTRGDVMRHITDAFENEPVGTRLTVAQIRLFESPNSGYEGRLPSAGAISARLNAPSWSVEKTGIEPGKEPGQTFGATKVAEPAAA